MRIPENASCALFGNSLYRLRAKNSFGVGLLGVSAFSCLGSVESGGLESAESFLASSDSVMFSVVIGDDAILGVDSTTDSEGVGGAIRWLTSSRVPVGLGSLTVSISVSCEEVQAFARRISKEANKRNRISIFYCTGIIPSKGDKGVEVFSRERKGPQI